MSKPISADAWENGRWKMEWSEMPVSGFDTLPLPFSRRYPVRCLWCGRELQSNVIAHRNTFIEDHSHTEFPSLPDIPKGRYNMKTRDGIALDILDDNPWQPRAKMDQGGLQDLADDIHDLGLLQVPLVRPSVDGRFELAFGHRRVAACRLLFQQEKWGHFIDVDIEDLTDEKMALIALSENVQRQQLTQIEVVRAHKRAIDDTELTIQALADKIGVNRATLSNNLRVLDLPGFVLEHVESGDMSMSSAREFLALQHDDHAHIDDMQDIVRSISRFYGRRGIPDWSRRHVRERIYLHLAYNEKDWRPLGPKPAAHTVGGANKEATFDVEAFRAAFPNNVHTIPAVSKTETVNYELQLTCDASRLWTCQVKEWSRRQSRATREASKAAVEAGKTPDGRTKVKADKNSQLGELLAKDPVWKAIAAAREEKGPHRPVTDEERQQLGTRAELKEVGYNRNPFWKVLERAGKNVHPNRWMDEDGGLLPPFFADLDGCKSCTAGAAYFLSPYHINSKPRLACFNKRCYTGKLEAGAAEYREKLEDHKKGLLREDRETAQRFVRSLESVDGEGLRALATALVAQTDKLELQHPFGEFVAEWSYEAGATSRAREVLGLELRAGGRGVHYLDGDGLKALENVDQGDLRELVANLMVHHLRIVGRMDTVSRETVAP